MDVPEVRLKPVLTFARLAARDVAARPADLASPTEHLLAAERWLCRAQDASADGGVSYGYSIKGGWRPSYPETSGYIASTFFRLSTQRDPMYLERGQRILDWLLQIQNDDGSFANHRYGPEGIVFDTGQVLFGFLRGYEATGDDRFLTAASRAAAWLTRAADADRLWTRNEHLSTPHVYNSRTAWALLAFNEISKNPVHEAVARANLDWARAEQRSSGFFGHCGFRPGQDPYTHTTAYAARGLLEAGLLLDDVDYVHAAVRCADATARLVEGDGFLASRVTPSGTAKTTTCCLTGNCQFAIIWLRLSTVVDRPSYREVSRRALRYVMATQDLTSRDDDVRGAVKGSQPVWGPYAPLSLPNWAAKFFVDAMWLQAAQDR